MAAEIPEWQLRQTRTFAKWCNMYLAKKGYTAEDEQIKVGAEFGDSFKDGVRIMKLLNALYDIPMPRKYKKGAKTRVLMLDNVNQALKMIDAAEITTVGLKQVSILDGDFRMMAGMIWCVILDYNIKGISVEDATAKQGLLIWCQKKTKHYQGINGEIRNFTKAWKNGNAFLALVDKHTTGMVDYDAMFEDATPEDKLDAAFSACEQLGIPRLLEVGDLTEVERPDDKAVMTYVSEMFKLFSKEDVKENAANHIARFLTFQRHLDDLCFKFADRYRAFREWAEAKTAEFEQGADTSNNVSCGEATQGYKTYLLEEKPHQMAEVVDIQDLFANIQGELKVNGRAAYEPEEDCQPNQLNTLVNNLNQAEQNYTAGVRTAREGLIEKMDDGDVLSDDKLNEIKSAFSTFDADKSGHLNKAEFSAALCAIGVALMDEELDRTFQELKSGDNHVSAETFEQFLVHHFTTSDDVDSVMKSLQVLGDPNNIDEGMFSQLSPEDREYIMSKSEEGSLASFINSSFTC